nr:unnamed protein product [Spirometra erinaceieuropaei]
MWVSFVVIGGVSCAANSLVFAQYILQPFYPDCEQPKVVLQIAALLCLLLICAINAYKVKWAARVAVIFSTGKIFALLLITGFGVYYLATGHLESFENPFEGSATSPGLLALAFYQGFWAFSGWNYLNFLVEEMDNPGRNLPLAIVLGLALVTGLYMLANVAYLAVLSPFELLGSGEGSAAVAVLFANRAMPWIAHAMPVFVGASVFGSINSEVMSMSRLAFAGARQGHMPTVLALVHHENLTPLPSILAITEDTRLPKQLFYGDVATGARRPGGSKRRCNDALKNSLRRLHIDPETWENLVQTRPVWRRELKTGAAIYEANRIAAVKTKRAARKSQDASDSHLRQSTPPSVPALSTNISRADRPRRPLSDPMH